MSRGKLILVWLIVTLAAGCHQREAPVDRDNAAALETFASFERCLIGPPLASGESLSARLRGIELARPAGWPERCRPLAERAHLAAKSEPLLREALGRPARKRLLDIDEEAWVRAHEGLDIPLGELPPELAPPPPPLQIPPPPPPLLEGVDFMRLDTGPPGVARFLLDDTHLCAIEPANARWVGECWVLPPTELDRRPVVLDAEPGAPLWVELGDRPYHLVGDRFEPLAEHLVRSRSVARRGGELFWLEQLSDRHDRETWRLQIRASADERQIDLPFELRSRDHLSIRGPEMFWTRRGQLYGVALEAEGLASSLASPTSLGPLASAYTIGARCDAGGRTVLMTSRAKPKLHETTTRDVRLFSRDGPDQAWTYVDTEIEQGPSTTRLGFYTVHAPAADLSCDDHSARLTKVDRSALEFTRCTSATCERASVELGWLENASWASAWRREQLLVVWHERGFGLRARIATPDKVGADDELVLADLDRGRLEALRVLPLAEAVIVVVAWEQQLSAIWITDDRRFGPVELRTHRG